MNIVDNRSNPRISTIFSVDISGHGGNYAVDIGCGGIRLVSRQPLDDKELEFCLHLTADTRIVIKGRPVWQQRMTRSGKTIAGVAFAVGQDEARAQLRSWIESNHLS
jgi:hypothetical protein